MASEKKDGTEQLKNLNLSQDETSRLVECFKQKEFRDMFFDYVREISEPGKAEEYNKMIQEAEKMNIDGTPREENQVKQKIYAQPKPIVEPTLPKNTSVPVNKSQQPITSATKVTNQKQVNKQSSLPTLTVLPPVLVTHPKQTQPSFSSSAMSASEPGSNQITDQQQDEQQQKKKKKRKKKNKKKKNDNNTMNNEEKNQQDEQESSSDEPKIKQNPRD
ncbi:MAG: hypothetical protein EZS28_037339 [Streblomastix strix]|uniref:Uncharacterized protein n=1 Tax=Streblomastix strix TaxID=222440 RepID=A0A5J4UBZ9_9EUKA|nr:MAG: hypothetical protein EZS28_037339 [Streblomastix strix]